MRLLQYVNHVNHVCLLGCCRCYRSVINNWWDDWKNLPDLCSYTTHSGWLLSLTGTFFWFWQQKKAGSHLLLIWNPTTCLLDPVASTVPGTISQYLLLFITTVIKSSMRCCHVLLHSTKPGLIPSWRSYPVWLQSTTKMVLRSSMLQDQPDDFHFSSSLTFQDTLVHPASQEALVHLHDAWNSQHWKVSHIRRCWGEPYFLHADSPLASLKVQCMVLFCSPSILVPLLCGWQSTVPLLTSLRHWCFWQTSHQNWPVHPRWFIPTLGSCDLHGQRSDLTFGHCTQPSGNQGRWNEHHLAHRVTFLVHRMFWERKFFG